jgi:hypothetical protein
MDCSRPLRDFGGGFGRQVGWHDNISGIACGRGVFRATQSDRDFDADGEFGQTEDRLPRVGLLSSAFLVGSGRMGEERVKRRLAAILCTDAPKD